MSNKWLPKIFPKLFYEMSDEISPQAGKKCPFLKPFEYRSGVNTRNIIEQECMCERCQIWDEEEQTCSIHAILKRLRKQVDT